MQPLEQQLVITFVTGWTDRGDIMTGVAVIGCGGGGCNIVSDLRSSCEIIPVTINVAKRGNDVTIPMDLGDMTDCRGDPILAWTLTMDHKKMILDTMVGNSAIITVAVLGGGVGSGSMSVVLECAKTLKLTSIAIVGIPFSVETSRRKAALDQLQDVIGGADRTIIFDMDRTIVAVGGDTNIPAILNKINVLMCDAICRISSLLDGPFFSLFSEKAYTVAYADSADPEKAAMTAISNGYTSTDPSHGKIIIDTDSEFWPQDIDLISNAVCNKTGIFPEVVSQNKGKGHGMMMFIPIAYRTL
jgi:cell division protein FtsZ